MSQPGRCYVVSLPDDAATDKGRLSLLPLDEPRLGQRVAGGEVEQHEGNTRPANRSRRQTERRFVCAQACLHVSYRLKLCRFETLDGQKRTQYNPPNRINTAPHHTSA